MAAEDPNSPPVAVELDKLPPNTLPVEPLVVVEVDDPKNPGRDRKIFMGDYLP